MLSLFISSLFLVLWGLIPQVGYLIAMILAGSAGIIAYMLIYLELCETRPIEK